MPIATVPLLTTWQGFYSIVGTAAATLTGLMFVVISLNSRLQRPGLDKAIAAFSTPNVAHFCAALLVAATLSAPWEVLWNISLLLGLCGLGGMIYAIVVGLRMRHQLAYQPVLEDWLWHLTFPLVSYTALLVAALILPSDPVPALFVIGAVMVLLLFVGIHNAWDAVAYMTVTLPRSENNQRE